MVSRPLNVEQGIVIKNVSLMSTCSAGGNSLATMTFRCLIHHTTCCNNVKSAQFSLNHFKSATKEKSLQELNLHSIDTGHACYVV